MENTSKVQHLDGNRKKKKKTLKHLTILNSSRANKNKEHIPSIYEVTIDLLVLIAIIVIVVAVIYFYKVFKDSSQNELGADSPTLISSSGGPHSFPRPPFQFEGNPPADFPPPPSYSSLFGPDATPQPSYTYGPPPPYTP
ncbi:uncharacterized protein Eint_111650 [Encephalitozoon intestinalis ATCC 50506]|uniref:Transmembrane protein n=1 Tax=Encephalitozoon intestinalis (strain ATCC 50506) TaxID=876142 RepID=E0SA42_ENCIT|nr:uncharacterized protein Eint_111650 [Encephalitozoon intestinalis ATCC 50506]ADM12664.1 hypothetical protein Eint_111650 [Encephalitozoon intestinalis ATCC 50506]UTX46525.1 hypothetical protein GPK93_11g21370 [Encephalitozoon intestinalis]